MSLENIPQILLVPFPNAPAEHSCPSSSKMSLWGKLKCQMESKLTRMAPGGRPGLLGLSSRFSCWLKSDLGTWSIVSPCARTDPIQIARIFDNLDAPGLNFMRNYVLDIPNWQNVPRCSQSSAFSLGAMWFSCPSLNSWPDSPNRGPLWKPGKPGTNYKRMIT